MLVVSQARYKCSATSHFSIFKTEGSPRICLMSRKVVFVKMASRKAIYGDLQYAARNASYGQS